MWLIGDKKVYLVHYLYHVAHRRELNSLLPDGSETIYLVHHLYHVAQYRRERLLQVAASFMG